MSTADDAPWRPIARRKQRERASKIPKEWQIPSDSLPKDPPEAKDGPQNVLDVPRQFLSRSEVSITESHTIPSLLTAISTRRLSAEEVATAFCHRAAIAHQLTNCLTEILFDECIKRAKELDQYLSKYRRPIGPLHGLPISIKDGFHIKGVDSSIGITTFCYKPAKANAPLVDLLLSLGCVIVSKTNVPQTLASLDSINNVFGRTMNPWNRLLSAGGSSGGEGVLVAMKGSMIGFGTDIGGSIRIPAAHNAIYGFKPGSGRIPYGGQASMGIEGMGASSIEAVAGPLARSVEDIDVVLREVIPRAKLWGEDCLASTWSEPSSRKSIAGSAPNGDYVIGILRSDGNCALLPPITNLLNEVSASLRQTPGIKVLPLTTPKAWTKSQSVMSKLMGVGSNYNAAKLLSATSEPLVPWMSTRFKSSEPQPLTRVAEIQSQRSSLQRDLLQNLWVQTDTHNRRRRKLDCIVCPVAAHPIPEIDRYNAVGLTSSWVLLDCPAGTIPVREVTETDLELGKEFDGGKVLGSWDEKNRELWDEEKTDRTVYLGSVLSVQVVTARGEDEALIQAMRVVDGVVGMKRESLGSARLGLFHLRDVQMGYKRRLARMVYEVTKRKKSLF